MPDDQPTNPPEPNARKPFPQFVDYKDTFIFWVLDRYGLPLLLLFCIGYAGVQFAKWLQPRADQLINKHIEIVDTAKQLGQESLEVQKDVKDLMDKVVNDGQQMDATTKEHMRVTTELRGIAVEMREDVKDIHRVVVPVPLDRPRPTSTPPTASVPQ